MKLFKSLLLVCLCAIITISCEPEVFDDKPNNIQIQASKDQKDVIEDKKDLIENAAPIIIDSNTVFNAKFSPGN